VNTLFFRLLSHEDKATALSEALAAVLEGYTLDSVVHAVDPASFRQVPGSPFAYWVSERVRHLFAKLPTFDGEKRTAKRGPSTCDDFRYVRCWWEVDCTQPHGLGEWRPFAKGGMFSPFYADIHLVVDWEPQRSTFLGFFGRPGREIERPESVGFFFRPGLTWPLRTQSGLALRVLPTGCIFGHKGPAVFVEGDDTDDLLTLLAIADSLNFRQLVNLQIAFGSYEVGVIQRTPVPVLTPETTRCLATLAHRAWSVKYRVDTASETSHAFILPALLQVPGESLTARALAWTERVGAANAELARIQVEIDEHAFNLYGIHGLDRENMLETADDTDDAGAETDDDSEDSEEITQVDTTELVAQLLSYGIGLLFGRLDLALALGRRPLPPEPEPFAPLPVCSPGMLSNANGLPAAPEDVPRDYPLPISWPGILVDDQGHPEDIVGRVREAIEVIWQERASDIEREACDILSVKSLRDYFTKPNNFFVAHLKRYSKSRRQAPIYWPLQTPSGSYTLWLYVHRLTDQTLYTCVNDFVGPKLKQLTEQLDALRTKTSRSKQEDKELERLLDFEQELKAFRDELLRVARFWKPNLNDGVQITAAPLWKLFRHKPWQKTLRDTWEKLGNGAYDWAHLAYSLWPDRVRDKCKHDKSLAIAHGLEELYEAQPGQPRTKRERIRG
jgi:hypothetical protein